MNPVTNPTFVNDVIDLITKSVDDSEVKTQMTFR